jgi:predicted dehydrogenase
MQNKTAIIIGGGAVGVDFHLPRLRSLCGAAEVLIVEPGVQRLEQLQARLGSKEVSLVAKLPASGSYSIAVVATPPKFHLDYVEQLAGRCEQLLVEKPLARNFGEAQRIAELTAKAGQKAFVCHIRRALHSFRAIRQLVAEGVFGKLQTVRVYEGSVFRWRVASMGSFSRDLNGGGVLMDTGPHTIDLLLQVFDSLTLTGSEMDAPIRSQAGVIEANCRLSLVGDERTPVELTLSRNRNLSNKAYFQFDKALITADVRDNTMELLIGDQCRLRGIPLSGTAKAMNFPELFDAFYRDYVLANDNCGVSPQSALPVMRVIDEAYAQAKMSQEIF